MYRKILLYTVLRKAGEYSSAHPTDACLNMNEAGLDYDSVGSGADPTTVGEVILTQRSGVDFIVLSVARGKAEGQVAGGGVRRGANLRQYHMTTTAF